VAAKTDLGRAYKASSYGDKVQFTREVREKLLASIPTVIDALIHEATHSKNSQARVSASRTLVRMAYIAGVLERDALRDMLSEFNTEVFAELENG
jgi:hypothetical protein